MQYLLLCQTPEIFSLKKRCDWHLPTQNWSIFEEQFMSVTTKCVLYYTFLTFFFATFLTVVSVHNNIKNNTLVLLMHLNAVPDDVQWNQCLFRMQTKIVKQAGWFTPGQVELKSAIFYNLHLNREQVNSNISAAVFVPHYLCSTDLRFYFCPRREWGFFIMDLFFYFSRFWRGYRERNGWCLGPGFIDNYISYGFFNVKRSLLAIVCS